MLIDRILNSFSARKKNFLLRFYRYTRHGMVFQRLQHKYAGKRCFVIGNGPSLQAEDLEKLKGEFSFASNRVYKIFAKTSWRPMFYCSEDAKMLAGCVNEVSAMNVAYKFIPYYLHQWYGFSIRNATYFLFDPKQKYGTLGDFCPDAFHGFGGSSTVTYTAMQMAVFMGFTEIYLLGVDHSFSTSMNNKGEIVIDKTAKDYFDDSYNADKHKLDIPNTEQSTLAYRAARAYADQHGIKILNATRGGKLEVFDRVDFDSLFSQKPYPQISRIS